MSTSENAASPLAGVKILEVSQYIAGPYCGQQLADAGASVIKVERGPGGDPMRAYASGKAPLLGPNFTAINRNKKSVVLDLQSNEGIESFKALAAEADVVLENFRPDVMDRLGIGYEALRAANPRLIYCSIAGFAADGPDARRPSFDSVGQALSGLLYLFTDPDQPVLRGPTISDQITGLFASNAILSALVERARTNAGRRIDVSMMDATMSFIPDALTFYNDCGIEWDSEFRAGVSHSLVIACASNELLAIHMAGPDRMWHGLAKVAEREDMLTDPRFATRENRVENWKLLIDELRPVFAKRSRAEWMSALISVDVPAAEVLRIPEVMASEGVKHAKMFEQFEHPIAGTMTMIRRAARFDGLRGAPQAPPPMLGEHTAEVLEAIGKGKPFS